MRVLVCGSRLWTDRLAVKAQLSALGTGPHTIIHGAAAGADKIAGDVAREYGWTVEEFPAQWSRYGKAAGMIRNREMLDTKPDVVLAFPLPSSIGTFGCIREAHRRKIPVKIP